MQKAIICLIVLLIAISAFAQDTDYPAGCYMSFKELLAKAPSKNCKLHVEVNNGVEFFFINGNDYSVSPKEECITKKEIRKEMLAYCDSGKLYVNCSKMQLYAGYSQVVVKGNKYIAFYGNSRANITMPLSGGTVTGLSQYGPDMRYLYAIDMATGKLHYVTHKGMENLLADNEDLLNRYRGEPNAKSDETMLYYIYLCN